MISTPQKAQKFEVGKTYVGTDHSGYSPNGLFSEIKFFCSARTKCYITIQRDGYPPAKIFKKQPTEIENEFGIETIYNGKFYWLPEIMEARECAA